MKSNIYHLQYDYIEKNGTQIIMEAVPELASTDLAEIQVKMLQSNRIPRILPFSINEQDMRVKLIYTISNKKMISHAVKANVFSIQDFYKVMVAVFAALEDSKTFMLKEERYILNEKFIFIGRDYEDIYLTYAPIKEIPSKKSLQEELQVLAAYLIGYVKNIQANEIRDILYLLQVTPFDISNLKQKIIEIQNNGKGNIADCQQSHFGQPQLGFTQGIILNDVLDSNAWQPVKETSISRTKSKFTILFIGLSFIAFIWNIGYHHPNEGSLLLSCGLTVFVADAIYVLLTFWDRIPSVNRLLNRKLSNRLDKHQENLEIEVDRLPIVQGTTLLPATQATVLLSNLQLEKKMIVPSAFFEIQNKDKKESVQILGDRFVIGRGASSDVHYTDDRIGVSRLHIEITKLSNEELEPSNNSAYMVQDLGAKNGTLLNNETMVPYKQYQLQDGDIITIICSDYVFKKIS
jgi:hypothetical protein